MGAQIILNYLKEQNLEATEYLVKKRAGPVSFLTFSALVNREKDIFVHLMDVARLPRY